MTLTLVWMKHWFVQGLKLWLFAGLASIFVMPVAFVLALVNEMTQGLANPDLLVQVGVILLQGVGFVVGLALFTAILASQLKEHPLLPFPGGGED